VLSGRPQVAVAVEPPMFADALIRLLERMGVQVVIDLRDRPSVGGGRFDVVITTADWPVERDADLSVQLAGPGEDSGTAWLQRGSVRFPIPIPDLQTALDLVRAFCPAGAAWRPR
jgi:hypothetical protein